MVSPQFHLLFDDLFETVTKLGDIHIHTWQQKTHFDAPDKVNQREKASEGAPLAASATNPRDILTQSSESCPMTNPEEEGQGAFEGAPDTKLADLEVPV
jgi:hypothetical protein